MGSNDREGWFEEEVVPQGKRIRLRRPEGPATIREGDEVRVGNTIVRIRGRQAARDDRSVADVIRDSSPEPRLEAIRSQPAQSARRQSRDDLRSSMQSYAERQRQQLKQNMVATFWMVWPFSIGAIGAMMLLTGLARMNPLLVIVGLLLGILAWKGKQVADWFDAKEAGRKAARAEADRKAVELEAERRLAAEATPEQRR